MSFLYGFIHFCLEVLPGWGRFHPGNRVFYKLSEAFSVNS